MSILLNPADATTSSCGGGFYTALLPLEEGVFVGDPIGVAPTGKVNALGVASLEGRQEVLAKGNFYGSITRTPSGAIGLGGGDKDILSAKGDVLIGGEPTRPATPSYPGPGAPGRSLVDDDPGPFD